jgi:hypothetical protein
MNNVELQERLQKLKSDRKIFFEQKGLILKKLLSQKEENLEHGKIADDLKEIDREVESLEYVISNSITLASSLINPIKEKERIRSNINKTIDLLDTENKIKNLLLKLKTENKIENKINIILEANNLIKINHSVFDNYRELFLKESQDVLNYLHNNFDELKRKLFEIIGKEGMKSKDINPFISDLDKNSILNYKLTNDETAMSQMYDLLSEYVVKLITKSKYNDFIDNAKSGNADAINSICNFILQTFLKIATIVNERKIFYFKEFGDYQIFNFLIKKIIKNIEPYIDKVIQHMINSNETDLDLVCSKLINVVNGFEKFKFFIYVLHEKIQKYSGMHEEGEKYQFFRNFNTMLYDLGEKYGTSEVKFMKDKLIFIFKEESKTFQTSLEKYLNSSFDELIQINLQAIDDFFYILKISGSRAIESQNLQISLAIINNIKNILSEDLLSILDIKISAIIGRLENKSNIDIKYICKEDPSLSNKFTYSNLFLITCINAIEQCKSNISDLLEEFKDSINELVASVDHTKIVLDGVDNLEYNYYTSTEKELINITFNDVDTLLKKYDDYLQRKLKNAFEYFIQNIKTTVDLLNSFNYNIEGSNISLAEVYETFSSKFIEATDKYLKQWKAQLSENGFNIFIKLYVQYVSNFIETALMMKRFSTYGVLILEKDINRIVNYFQAKVSISIRDKFNKLINIVKVLNFETREELIEYLQRYNDVKLSKAEIDQIRKLKK